MGRILLYIQNAKDIWAAAKAIRAEALKAYKQIQADRNKQ